MHQASSGSRRYRKTVAGRGAEQRAMQMPETEDGSVLATAGAESQDAAAGGCQVLGRQRLGHPSDAQAVRAHGPAREHQARVAWGLMEPGQFPPPERTVPASQLWSLDNHYAAWMEQTDELFAQPSAVLLCAPRVALAQAVTGWCRGAPRDSSCGPAPWQQPAFLP
ncbi:unnamed protein product [Rangifer tarandus platyrhynchus]|uniref:Uncharacterized protein n=1 Tax=Rangifer tarandus platyrhynchus TaxID=3082113 RepID=A0ABN8Y769_RANTA|nr:unnamed protein product [Rangifer tarandus platyrhynchus]